MASIASYEKRLKQLQSWRTAAKNAALVEKYDRAIALTERAAETYLRLLDAAEAEQKAYLTYSDAQVASILGSMRSLEQEAKTLEAKIKSERDDSKRAVLNLDARHLELARMTVQIRSDTFLLNTALRHQKVDKVPAMQNALFDSVFKPDQKEFSKDAAIKAVEFAIGVFPGVGTVYDGTKKLWELSRRDKVKGRQADEHLTYLDDYCVSVARWCVAGEALIQSLKDSEDIYDA
jgi:hypothetical protein